MFPEQFTVNAQDPLISTWLYKTVASMKAAIFNCQCDQMQNWKGGCETIYLSLYQLHAKPAKAELKLARIWAAEDAFGRVWITLNAIIIK